MIASLRDFFVGGTKVAAPKRKKRAANRNGASAPREYFPSDDTVIGIHQKTARIRIAIAVSQSRIRMPIRQLTQSPASEGADRPDYFFSFFSVSPESAAMKASWGTSTRPTIFMRFLPSFCFSRSLRFRVMSPP